MSIRRRLGSRRSWEPIPWQPAFGRTGDALPAALPYRINDRFLSKAELSLYGVLRLAVADRMVICPKVRLADLFDVVGTVHRRSYRNRIDRKHVDFLLCDSQTLRPIMGVELDDKSHARPDRQERDVFKDQVFHAAGLPLVRIPARAAYSPPLYRSAPSAGFPWCSGSRAEMASGFTGA